MPLILKTDDGTSLTLEERPFASGGEGDIHRILSPTSYQNACVKLYFSQYRTHQKKQKTLFQVKNKPSNIEGDRFIVCWPSEVVYENGKFAGFVMPLAFPNSLQLYELCLPTIKKNLSPEVQQKFNRKALPNSLISRLKLCVNIALAVHEIHSTSTGQYVMVDMKPQNILFTEDGRISIIDIDSIQISKNGAALFHAAVATPEYVPIEGHKGMADPAKTLISKNWDHFSLAVIFYEIIFGIHPYVATFNGPFSNLDAIAEKIKNGLFVYGSKSGYVHVRPTLHENFLRTPIALQKLFTAAFEAEHRNADIRPSAEEWGQTIYSLVSSSKLDFANFSAPITTNPAPRAPVGPAVHIAKDTSISLAKKFTAFAVPIMLVIAWIFKHNQESGIAPPTQFEAQRFLVQSQGELYIRACAGVSCSKVAKLQRSSTLVYLGERQIISETGKVHTPWIKVALEHGEYCAPKNFSKNDECLFWESNKPVQGWVNENKLSPTR